MKKLILTLVLLISIKYYSTAQDSISFKVHYLPLHKYEQVVRQQYKSTTTFSADDSILAVLKSKGITNPMIINKSLTVKSVAITGDYNDSMTMPIRLEFEEAKDNDDNNIIPKGAGLMGTVKKDQMPQLDSVVLPDRNDIATKSALSQVKNILQQIHLPNKKMKLGDEYEYKTPLSIPVSGTVMKASLSIVYKLTNATDTTANFDLLMNIDFNMDSTLLKNNKGSGNGSGILTYDRINDFPIIERIDYTMQMTAGNKQKTVKVELESHSFHNFIISKL